MEQEKVEKVNSRVTLLTEKQTSNLETHAAVRSNKSVKRELMDRTGGVHQQTVESV